MCAVVKEDTVLAVKHLGNHDALQVGVHLGEALEANGQFQQAALLYTEIASMVPAPNMITHGRHHSV